MKTTLLSILACFFAAIGWAQPQQIHLFDEFQNAVVIYEDGRQFTVPINFDYNLGEFVFIDKGDRDLIKQFADPSLIRHIKIGDRFFLSSDNSGSPTEIISQEPYFYVQHRGLLKNAPQSLSYGGTTQTASVDNYTGSFKGKGIISADKKSNKVLVGIEKVYEVKIGKKRKSFSDKKEFLKIFPKQKRASLETFIDERNIDFTSLGQVFQLYQYAIKQ